MLITTRTEYAQGYRDGVERITYITHDLDYLYRLWMRSPNAYPRGYAAGAIARLYGVDLERKGT